MKAIIPLILLLCLSVTPAQAVNYTITVICGTGGYIAPSGPVTVAAGGVALFTITANTGYAIQNVWVDGVTFGPITSYCFNPVNANHILQAQFKQTGTPPTNFSVDLTAGLGGSTTPAPGHYDYSAGSSFTATAIGTVAGYSFSYWLINGNQNPSNPLTFTVDKDYTVKAVFDIPGQFNFLNWLEANWVIVCIGFLLLIIITRR